MAVNVRLAPPEAVLDLPIDHFDGFDTFEDQPSTGELCAIIGDRASHLSKCFGWNAAFAPAFAG